MDSLREKLLKLCDGTHAQSWVSRTDLLAQTGVGEEEFFAAYEQLRITRVINTCNIIRSGVTIEAVWLTGSVAKALWKDFAVNPAKRPPSGSLRREQAPTQQPNKPAKEEIMEEQKPEKSIPQQVLDIIICEPGITPSALRSRLPNDRKTMKAVSNALNNLRVAKRIERRDDNGTERLHPTSKAGEPCGQARKKKLPYKLLESAAASQPAETGAGAVQVAGKSLINDGTATETTKAADAAPQAIIPPIDIPGSNALEIVYSDGDVLKLTRGYRAFDLSHPEIERLRRFINRLPEAACA